MSSIEIRAASTCATVKKEEKKKRNLKSAARVCGVGKGRGALAGTGAYRWKETAAEGVRCTRQQRRYRLIEKAQQKGHFDILRRCET